MILLDVNDFDNKKLGGKASALASLHKNGFNIPDWFVIPSTVFTEWLEKNPKSPERFKVDGVVKKEISKRVGSEKLYAVRSSANAEDGKTNSFAGQFETYLNVKGKDLPIYIKKVFLSGLSERVKKYAKDKNISLSELIPSVIVQEQINSDKSGVVFSVNPVTGNFKEIVISAVWGLGMGLVDGTIDADTVIVNKDNARINRTIGKKTVKFICSSSGVEEIPIPENEQKEDVLSKNETRKIAELANKISEIKGSPQDIEWAIKDNTLYLLQSRPITTLSQIENTIDKITVWDNSNIVESYSGVTTPLTYSFIKYAYGEVYKQMCKMFNTSQKILDYNEYTFSHMLGLIHGRVYYNMISWYKLLTMLPGYNFNKDFMIQMMGAKEPISEEALKRVEKEKCPTTKLEDTKGLICGLSGAFTNYCKIKKLTDEFYTNVNDAINSKQSNLENMSLSELAEYYRNIERKLIKKWDAPVINDFFAMIFYGLLRKYSENWLNGELKEIYNDLLCGDGQIISTQPAKKIKEIALLLNLQSGANINEKTYLPDIFKNGSINQINKVLEKHPDINQKIEEYINTFGGRCLEELKLETETLEDNPLLLYRTIGHAACIKNTDAEDFSEIKLREEAEKRYKELLKTHLIKKLIYKFIVNKTRYFVRNRENLRFERTRIFGTVRKIMVEIGNKLYLLGLIDDKRDVFYLELEEILGFIEGNATTVNLKDIISVRKKTFEEYKKYNHPTRINTYGAVNINNSFKDGSSQETTTISGDSTSGIGCCPGVVRGKIRIVTDPRNANLKSGEILVAERTDPGWIMLFPIASAVLVEKGSLLSHAAIVVREMGIPAVVGVDNLLNWLKDGELVEINGATGEIKKLKGEI